MYHYLSMFVFKFSRFPDANGQYCINKSCKKWSHPILPHYMQPIKHIQGFNFGNPKSNHQWIVNYCFLNN